jgi:hypothetical protein
MRRIALLGFLLASCQEAHSEIPTPTMPAIVRDVITTVETTHYSSIGTEKAEAACHDGELLTGGGCRCVAAAGAAEDPHLVSCTPRGAGYYAKCTPDAELVEVQIICQHTKVINVVARRWGDPFTYSVDAPKPVTEAK